jgi:hypothetical protein
MRHGRFDTFETAALFVLILVAASSACVQQVSTPAPTPEPTATRSATRSPVATTTQTWTAEVELPVVNVRDAPCDEKGENCGEPTGKYLNAGDTVIILRCVYDWCRVKEPVGWVYRGCISDNPKDLGCMAK